jgi:hypothetical protein
MEAVGYAAPVKELRRIRGIKTLLIGRELARMKRHFAAWGRQKDHQHGKFNDLPDMQGINFVGGTNMSALRATDGGLAVSSCVL